MADSIYDTATEVYADNPLVLRARIETFATTKLELFFHDIPLATGTAFVYRFADQYALITNWHNLAGAHPETRIRRNTDGLAPNRIKFHLSVFKESGKYYLMPIDLSLIRDDKPIWFERAVEGITVDLAFIDLATALPNFEEIKSKIAYLRSQMVVRMDENMRPEVAFHAYPRVGNDVFVLGYPEGVSQGVFPIWKKGSIASEPLFGAVESGAPVILIDALSRRGMSGAPVLYFGSDVIGDLGPGSPEASSNRPWLVGVYAGREGVTAEEGDLSLGRVWKTEELEKLFNPAWRRPGPYLLLGRD